MNHDELIENLGTIARSGTAAFMNDAVRRRQKGSEPDRPVRRRLLFGLHGRRQGRGAEPQGRRRARAGAGKADGKGEFTIEPEPNLQRAARASRCISARATRNISSRTGCAQIVKTYSDHIALPIVLADGNKEETINTASALWTRPRAEITEEQYKEFYHHVGHGFDEPWLTLHARPRACSNTPTCCSCRSAKPFDLFDPERKTPGQALRPARLHHRRGHRAGAVVSALSARRRRQRGPAAQRQPRDAAVEPDGRAHAPAS